MAFNEIYNHYQAALCWEMKKIDDELEKMQQKKDETVLFDAMRIVLDIHETEMTMNLRIENQSLKEEVIELKKKLKNKINELSDYMFYNEIY